jgi:hypothetical protein
MEKNFKKAALIKTDYEEGRLQPTPAGHLQLATPRANYFLLVTSPVIQIPLCVLPSLESQYQNMRSCEHFHGRISWGIQSGGPKTRILKFCPVGGQFLGSHLAGLGLAALTIPYWTPGCPMKYGTEPPFTFEHVNSTLNI